MPDRAATPRNQPSLDEMVTQSAVVIGDQIQHAAALAKPEMDLQIEVVHALEDFAKGAQITLGEHHNIASP